MPVQSEFTVRSQADRLRMLKYSLSAKDCFDLTDLGLPQHPKSRNLQYLIMKAPHLLQNSDYGKLPFTQCNIPEDQNYVLIGFKVPIIITFRIAVISMKLP
jgi:hypothetical protein